MSEGHAEYLKIADSAQLVVYVYVDNKNLIPHEAHSITGPEFLHSIE